MSEARWLGAIVFVAMGVLLTRAILLKRTDGMGAIRPASRSEQPVTYWITVGLIVSFLASSIWGIVAGR